MMREYPSSSRLSFSPSFFMLLIPLAIYIHYRNVRAFLPIYRRGSAASLRVGCIRWLALPIASNGYIYRPPCRMMTPFSSLGCRSYHALASA